MVSLHQRVTKAEVEIKKKRQTVEKWMQLHDRPSTIFIWLIVNQIVRVCQSTIAIVEILMHLGWRRQEIDEVPVEFVWRRSCNTNDWLRDRKRVLVVCSDMLRQAATVEETTTASSEFA